jgi:serine/threonine protein kinase/TRAP-type uncharacterized transport system substrate-binding protein
MIDQSRSGNELEQVFMEYLRLVDLHGAVDKTAFVNRYSHLSQQLNELIDTAGRIEQMAGAPPTADEADFNASRAKPEPPFAETVIYSEENQRSSTAIVGSAGPLIGRNLGDYEILEELGRGGMGVVYKAWQTGMAREVALKMIRNGCLASENDVQRFYFEAKAAGRLNHSMILDVYEVGEIEGHHFFSMEYVAGDNLAEYARQQKSSWPEIANMLRQVAEAIDYAHKQGLLHRDLKPSNILVDSQGRPRIADFGLAKDLHSADQLTSSGATIGTPSYMSPEQAQSRRDEITVRSDVYSLGAILYTLLTGQPPFRADSTIDTLMQVIQREPVPPRVLNSACPYGLEAICLKCLQKSSSQRYATARDLAEDLERFLQGERVLARHSRAHHRAWQWLSNVPLIAAVLGRKSINSTARHIVSQWIAITVLMGLVAGVIMWPRFIESRRLATIDLSTGPVSGKYSEIGQALAARLGQVAGHHVLDRLSVGTVDSHNRLVSGNADLALLQENAGLAASLNVVAPLYYEAILVMVRRDSSLEKISDLPGHRIALGPVGSGMRFSSRELLKYYRLNENQLLDVDRSYTDLSDHGELEGAFITIKINTPALQELLLSNKFRLLPLANDIPGFRKLLLREQDLPEGLVPPEGLLVPATFAVLAVRSQTPDALVTECLESLYAEGGVAEAFDRVFTRQQAAAWTDLNYHDAAERYFRAARGDP